ncbi:hypothetical protein [Mycobacteroides chelonae]|uniref:hypothetical protein n=1 Tax=Mycobacteroides chelonae TaxID=1774 RepID=UPI0008A91D24|nr:hypothetical protein [Mycobacteroides chelonae]OHU12784.1 hypothetical protein BKG75_17355 [Mycobacteroides chelonae]
MTPRWDDQRKNGWRKIHSTCVCGREIYGNGKSHWRSCEQHLKTSGWPMETAMVHALFAEGHGADIVRAVELGLGKLYLKRRAEGVKIELPWREYRDTVWQLADEAVQLKRG